MVTGSLMACGLRVSLFGWEFLKGGLYVCLIINLSKMSWKEDLDQARNISQKSWLGIWSDTENSYPWRYSLLGVGVGRLGVGGATGVKEGCKEWVRKSILGEILPLSWDWKMAWRLSLGFLRLLGCDGKVGFQGWISSFYVIGYYKVQLCWQ